MADELNMPGAAAITVAELEARLFGLFPAELAEDWDACGLLVGDGSAEVTGIAIALDPNVATIERACGLGCNVLLTHHPAYISAPLRFVDRAHGGTDAAARVVAAISNGVALVAMHTNLDRSKAAGEALAATFGLELAGRLLDDREPPAFGWIARPAAGEELDLAGLAARCSESYGVVPSVWGRREMPVGTVAIANGSSSSLIDDIVESKADCVVTGEMSYHNACEVASRGIGIVELGHDVSEFPLTACLREAVESMDGLDVRVEMLGPDVFWWQPGMERR